MEPTDLESRLRRELSAIGTWPASADEWAAVQKRRRRRAVSTPLVLGALTLAVVAVAALVLAPRVTQTKLVATPQPAPTGPPAPPPSPPGGPGIALTARLPAEGIMIDDGGGLKLLTLRGRLIQRLQGMRVVDGMEPGPIVLERKKDRARFLLEGGADRLRAWYDGTPLAYGAVMMRDQILHPDRPALVMQNNEEWHESVHRDVFSVLPYRRGSDRSIEYRSGAYAVDLRDGRRRPLPDGCQATDRHGQSLLLVCGSAGGPVSIDVLDSNGNRRKVVGSPPGRRSDFGMWRDAAWSPDGKEVGATWSGQCESTSAWRLGSTHRGFDRAVSRDVNESFFLAWATNGDALVLYTTGICGGGIRGGPGVYRIARHGHVTKIPGAIPPSEGASYHVRVWGPIP